jgi:hypothetical protein
MKVIQGSFGAAQEKAKKPTLEAIQAVLEGLPPLGDDSTFTLLIHSEGHATLASNEDTVTDIIGALEIAKTKLVMSCLG